MAASRSRWVVATLLLVPLTACAEVPTPTEGPVDHDTTTAVVIGIPGVTWAELHEASDPTLTSLIDRAAIANMSVRVANRLAEGYATLGAGRRTDADAAAGWAFERDVSIEAGTAEELYRRLAGVAPPPGEVLAVTVDQVRAANEDKAFDATPGLLATRLQAQGRLTAVVGNADFALGGLPSLLPPPSRMAERRPPEVAIHREAALAAMRNDGGVSLGSVERDLLQQSPSAPFGVQTDSTSLLAAFDEVLPESALVVIETGNTYRADIYSVGLPERRAQQMRIEAVSTTAESVVRGVLERIDLDTTLLVVIAPTTPGGPEARGQLRPVLLAGPGIRPGIATSPSTRRHGLVSIDDVSATIARYLGVATDRFAGGRPIQVSGTGSVEELIESNRRAVVNDALRTPAAAAWVAFQLGLFGAMFYLVRRRHLPTWMTFLLLLALAFPIGSFASRYVYVDVTVAAASILAATVAAGLIALAVERRRHAGGVLVLLGAATAGFLIDLSVGAPSQIDSVLGYTSVAAGRFFGLGNLGFALFASAGLLTAGMMAEWRRGRTAAMLLVIVLVVWVGHPRLGADLGGTLSLVPAVVVFGLSVFGAGRLKMRHALAALAAALLLTLAFAAIDMMRPAAERTHLGEFLAQVLDDPASVLVVIRRKLALAVGLAVSSRWGLALPGAVAVFLWLRRHPAGFWTPALDRNRGWRAGLDAVIVASILGSLLNDSGVAVAGMMLAIAAPWALLVSTAPGDLDSVAVSAASGPAG